MLTLLLTIHEQRAWVRGLLWWRRLNLRRFELHECKGMRELATAGVTHERGLQAPAGRMIILQRPLNQESPPSKATSHAESMIPMRASAIDKVTRGTHNDRRSGLQQQQQQQIQSRPVFCFLIPRAEGTFESAIELPSVRCSHRYLIFHADYCP